MTLLTSCYLLCHLFFRGGSNKLSDISISSSFFYMRTCVSVRSSQNEPSNLNHILINDIINPFYHFVECGRCCFLSAAELRPSAHTLSISSSFSLAQQFTFQHSIFIFFFPVLSRLILRVTVNPAMLKGCEWKCSVDGRIRLSRHSLFPEQFTVSISNRRSGSIQWRIEEEVHESSLPILYQRDEYKVCVDLRTEVKSLELSASICLVHALNDSHLPEHFGCGLKKRALKQEFERNPLVSSVPSCYEAGWTACKFTANSQKLKEHQFGTGECRLKITIHDESDVSRGTPSELCVFWSTPITFRSRCRNKPLKCEAGGVEHRPKHVQTCVSLLRYLTTLPMEQRDKFVRLIAGKVPSNVITSVTNLLEL
jgi:hypothetical protein